MLRLNKKNKAEKTKGKKARKEKKKKAYKKRREGWDNNTPAIRSNIKLLVGKKQKDFNQITYFNYNKKGDYSKNYTKP